MSESEIAELRRQLAEKEKLLYPVVKSEKQLRQEKLREEQRRLKAIQQKDG